MCIRDSVLREYAGEKLDQAESTYHLHAGWFLRRMADRSSPVSYTHLRAHETVLDLVCRLLLEKKKHNKHQSVTQHSIACKTVTQTMIEHS